MCQGFYDVTVHVWLVVKSFLFYFPNSIIYTKYVANFNVEHLLARKPLFFTFWKFGEYIFWLVYLLPPLP